MPRPRVNRTFAPKFAGWSPGLHVGFGEASLHGIMLELKSNLEPYLCPAAFGDTGAFQGYGREEMSAWIWDAFC
jgi:hypothetical protein